MMTPYQGCEFVCHHVQKGLVCCIIGWHFLCLLEYPHQLAAVPRKWQERHPLMQCKVLRVVPTSCSATCNVLQRCFSGCIPALPYSTYVRLHRTVSRGAPSSQGCKHWYCPCSLWYCDQAQRLHCQHREDGTVTTDISTEVLSLFYNA